MLGRVFAESVAIVGVSNTLQLLVRSDIDLFIRVSLESIDQVAAHRLIDSHTIVSDFIGWHLGRFTLSVLSGCG